MIDWFLNIKKMATMMIVVAIFFARIRVGT